MSNPFANWKPDQVHAHNHRVAMKTARQHNAQQTGEVELHSEGDQELRRLSKAPESRLHDQIIAHCNAQWPRWKYIHSRMDQRSTIAVGCHDFTIFAPGRILLVECKRVGGKLSIEQQAWALEMRQLGYTVHVIATFEEFLTMIS